MVTTMVLPLNKYFLHAGSMRKSREGGMGLGSPTSLV